MMKNIGKYILTGLVTMLPVILTLYLLYWLAVSAETLLGELIPQEIYFPGMGVAVALLAMFIVGMLMHTRPIRQIFLRGERIFYQLPVVKSIYAAFRDFMDYFSPGRKKDFEQVVTVTFGDTGMRLIGFVTQADDQLPEDFQRDYVMVYLPMSYMLGGYAVLVPRASVQPLNMSMEEAMRYVLTAGVTRLSTPV
ncbi:MAG: hypothetical protein BWY57_00207 [Betaproteobacteria bacterium ADurb.Bin341]|jgi:uncharacterized membrane protein|nr:MAG: hypothetical protein BWY57_00207 [Betaproteobacteria bacterium ADurb.Bin341]